MVTLSVYLDGPFWVGVLEIVEDGRLRATRFTLGSEPTDPQLYAFLMMYGTALLEQASQAPAVPSGTRDTKRVNPKRAAKLAARAAARVSSRSTASQEAMRLEVESRKEAAAVDRKAIRKEEAEHRREMASRKRRNR